MFALLDDEERRRHASIVHAIDRRRFVVAHAVTRRIVGAALGAPPHELRWTHNPNGKPSLAGPYTGVEVNLSHSGDLVMVAVSARRPVGVDLQRVVPTLDCAAMARRFYPPAEAAEIAGGGGTRTLRRAVGAQGGPGEGRRRPAHPRPGHPGRRS